jgi:predicted anti-sigma-YlaC factor YlaD
MKKTLTYLVIIFLSLTIMNSCSLKKMAMNKVADMLASPDSGTVFTGDNDPELVGDALPFAIKMYESLMVSMPWHLGLKLQTGSLYIMYANAFIQAPADMLSQEEIEKQKFLFYRAKNLYLRGRDILLKALDHKYSGFLNRLDKKEYDRALAPMKKVDVPLLYWAAAGWLGAFAIDPFDMKLGITVPRAAALMDRVLQLDPGFDSGAVHDFYTLYYGAMPDYMGGDFTKAREHFKKAIEASGGKITSPYLSLATTVAVKEQNLEEYEALLNKVLAVDPDADPSSRLINTINRRKAQWLLKHAEDFFLK